MAATGTPTPNIGLRIPQGTDPASVADINYNSTVIDQKMGPVGNTSLQEQINSAEEAMAYVVNGNDAPSGGIPSGKYVYVKNNTNGIATGMYITTAAISSGATVQASSLSACAEGAANALNGNIAKCHYYNTTITSKVHASDGALYRSFGRNININSSNVSYASISVVNPSYDCWACIVSITDNKINFVIESVDDINTEESFTIYAMTVDE